MTKQSFLIISLKESKARKLAQVISNETSIKILDYLTTKDATETELARTLDIPLSTVHYNLKILLDSKLVKSTEFHYSEKGKEVNHYTLANRYILIAPEKETGLREKLRSILPISVILLVAACAIQLISGYYAGFGSSAQDVLRSATPIVAEGAASTKALGVAAGTSGSPAASSGLISSLTSSITFWFITGAFLAILLFLLFSWLRKD